MPIRLLKYIHSTSLSFRLYAIIIPTTILAIALYGYLNARVISHMLDTQVEQSTRDIAAQLAVDMASGNVPSDPSKLHAWLEELIETNFFVARIDIFRETDLKLTRIASTSTALQSAVVIDESVAMREGRMQTLLQYREKERLLKVIAPVIGPLGTIGCVSVTSSLHQSDSFAKAHNRIALLLVPSTVLVLILMLHYFFTRLMTRRIGRLSHAMTEARTGNLMVRAPVEHRDELGIIAEQFNEAMDEIERAGAQRDQLLREQQDFNVQLQQKVREATHELSAANNRLRQVNQDLIDAQRLASQFERMAVAGQLSASIAHEIGSPLSALSTHIELLAEDAECSTESKRRIQIIQDQVDRITSFVEELLAETRSAAQTGRPLQLNEVVEQVVRFLEEHLTKQRVQVELRLSPDLPDVHADSQELQQVLLNLLNNAGDAMPDGGILKIATFVEEKPGSPSSVVVSVTDTGTGIPAERQAHIFEPFFTTKELKHGTGLGLGIAARIIRQYGGSIDFTSTPGTGTAFFVRLPAAVAHVELAAKMNAERQNP